MANGILDPRQEKLTTGLKWGLGIGLAVAASQIALLAIEGVAGIAVATGLGLFFTQLAPWYSFALSNLCMKLIIDDAKKNPIETLQNLRVAKAAEVAQADEEIIARDAATQNLRDKLDTLRSKYPPGDEVIKSYEHEISMQEEDLSGVKELRDSLQGDLEDLERRIEKANDFLELELALEPTRKFSKSKQAEVYAKIREKTAFDSVQSRMNHPGAEPRSITSCRGVFKQ